MNESFVDRRQQLRRLLRRNRVWIVPAALTAAVGLFFGLGCLVAWLWKATLVEILGIRPISSWQAWGLILLAQILFKANVQPTVRAGRRHRRAGPCGEAYEAAPGTPQGNLAG